MSRFVEKRSNHQSCKGTINPKPLKRLKIEIEESYKWTTKCVEGYKFEVGNYQDKFTVDLQSGLCNYNFWRLINLSCKLSYATIYYMAYESIITLATIASQQLTKHVMK